MQQELEVKLRELSSCDRHSYDRGLWVISFPSSSSSAGLTNLRASPCQSLWLSLHKNGERKLSLPLATRLNGDTEQLAGSPPAKNLVISKLGQE